MPSSLIHAIKHNKIDKLVRLLEDPRVDPAEDHNAAIIYAATYGRQRAVEKLLKDPRIDPTVSDNKALRMAIDREQTAVVDLLLNDPRVIPSRRVIIDAIYTTDNPAIIITLLSNPRCHPLPSDALYYAARNGNLTAVEYLLTNRHIDPACRENEAIRYASFYGNTAIVKRLLEDPRVDPAAIDNESVRDAIMRGYDDTAILLLQDPRVDPVVAFQKAIAYWRPAVILQCLANPRVDPTIEDNKAMREATHRLDIPMIWTLLADPRVAATWSGPASTKKASLAAERTGHFKEDLIAAAWHPDRFKAWCLDTQERANFGT